MSSRVETNYTGHTFADMWSCQLLIPYIAKFSRPKNFANRFQKGGAEIFATKIFAKAALIHCVIL